jgi:hypothetical protein
MCQTAMAQVKDVRTDEASEVVSLIVQYHADEGSLLRFYTISGSPERRQRLLEFYNGYATRIKSLPFENLSVQDRVDYLLFQRSIEYEIFILKEEARE